MKVNITLLSSSLVLLLYSALVCNKLNKSIDRDISKKALSIILVLIYSFIVGYLLFIVMLLEGFELFKLEHLTTTIFFLGSLFVVLVIELNAKLIRRLDNLSFDLKMSNKNLKNNNLNLINANKEQKISEQKLKERSEELEQTMSDFYDLRLDMENFDNNKILKNENQKIKNRLEELKENNQQ